MCSVADMAVYVFIYTRKCAIEIRVGREIIKKKKINRRKVSTLQFSVNGDLCDTIIYPTLYAVSEQRRGTV
jgi:hypothetical protein